VFTVYDALKQFNKVLPLRPYLAALTRRHAVVDPRRLVAADAAIPEGKRDGAGWHLHDVALDAPVAAEQKVKCILLFIILKGGCKLLCP